jgi:hypothetical protein
MSIKVLINTGDKSKKIKTKNIAERRKKLNIVARRKNLIMKR